MNSAEDDRIETSLDIGDWVDSLQKRLADTRFRDINREPTIYRVPDILKRVDPQAYEPLLISLGPYHRNKPDLKAMNQLKWKYLKFVLEQTSGLALENYLCEIKNLEKPARDAYSEEVKMSSKSFVEMMLLDGCFVMLTIMHWNCPMTIEEESTLWTRAEVLDDIFKLENQLPFFLLETLYKSAFPEGEPFRIATFKFIRMHTSSNLEFPSEHGIYHHIIHFFLSCIDPTTNNGDGNQSSTFGFLRCSKLAKTVVSFPPKLCSSLLSQVNKKFTVGDGNPWEDIQVLDLSWIPSATVLNEAGIHFVRKQNAKNFLDITFHRGKLEIPQLQIDDSTNSIWRNLIAYEQCSMGPNFHVSSYSKLMDCIIKTAEDVELLKKDEIIISKLGDSQEVATLFYKLPMNIAVPWSNVYFSGAMHAMLKQRETRYSKLRTRLNRDWAVFSLVGALVLFVLSLTQTIFAVLSYARSQN